MKTTDIQKEIDSFNDPIFDGEWESLKQQLGHDTAEKVGAIIRVLSIGSPSIAHSKMVLHVCEAIIEKCSLTFGTKSDV